MTIKDSPLVQADQQLVDQVALLDRFAERAMAAMISKSSGQDATGGKKGVPLVAKFAYEYAEAMLVARAAVLERSATE